MLAQKPIRILNSIRVPREWEAELIQNNFTSIPKNVKAHYASIPLGFEPREKLAELRALRDEIVSTLGQADELGRHLYGVCDEYMRVVEMLERRGTPDFYRFSRGLYGSPKDCFAQDLNTISEMAHLLYGILTGIGTSLPEVKYPEDIPAEKVVETLNQRFWSIFWKSEGAG